MPPSRRSRWKLGLAFLLALGACDAQPGPVSPNAADGSMLTASAVAQSAAGKLVVSPSPVLLLKRGDARRLTAVAWNAQGGQSNSRAYFHSVDTTVAGVDSTGLVIARGRGATTVTVTVDSLSVPVSVKVLNGTAPARFVDLTLRRFDGGSGLVTLSSGIPLPEGWLLPSEVGKAALFVSGVEVPIYAEALAGRHPDGSVRSLLVQTRRSLGTTPVAARLNLGSPRLTTDLAETPIVGGTLPAAALLPTDPVYLVSTELVGPTLTSLATAPLGASYVKYQADYGPAADNYWTECGPQWDCNWGNYYDRAHTYFAMWARSGNVEYWRRGMLQALNYRDVYLGANDFGTSPHWSQMRGMETHYLLSGEELSRTTVGVVADRFYGGLHEWFDQGEWDPRHQARVLESYLLAWRLGDTTRDWTVALDEGLTSILGTRAANGSQPITWECSESLPYMMGILNDVLAKYHRYYRADARIPTTIARSADWMWTQWVPSEGGFRYIDVACPDVGVTDAAPDLNLLIVNSYGWAYQYTGNPVHLARGELVFQEGVTHALLEGGKQFNEAYSSSFLYPALRRR